MSDHDFLMKLWLFSLFQMEGCTLQVAGWSQELYDLLQTSQADSQQKPNKPLMHQSFVTTHSTPPPPGTLIFRSENPCYKPHTAGINGKTKQSTVFYRAQL